MKKIIGLFIALCISTFAFAQDEFMMSEQLFSRINKNPAGMGNSLDVDVFIVHRQQWVGFGEGRPMTTMLNAHSYFEKAHSGVGMTFYHEMVGLGNQNVNFRLAYAYNIDLWDKGLLSLGASGGIFYKNFDINKHHIVDDMDDDLISEKNSKVNPDFDFGFEFVTPYVLVGASINHLGLLKEPQSLTPVQSYNAYVRGNILIGESDLKLNPAFLYMNASRFHIFEANLTAFYQNKYWLGLGYRHTSPNSTMMFIAGLEWKFFRIGYSYELPVGKLGNVSHQTHEILLSFKIPTKRVNGEW